MGQLFSPGCSINDLSVVYGRPAITSEQDPTIEAVNSFASRVTRAAYPGVFLVYCFPWMRHIPSR